MAFTATPRLWRRWSPPGQMLPPSIQPYHNAYMKLAVPAVGMALGWAFAGVVTACNLELDILKEQALASISQHWHWLAGVQLRSTLVEDGRLQAHDDDLTLSVAGDLPSPSSTLSAAPLAGHEAASEAARPTAAQMTRLSDLLSIFDDAAMALAISTVAVLILAAAVRVNSIAGRGASVQRRGPLLEWSLRIEYLLAECLALGAAAPWRIALDDLVPIRTYKTWLYSAPCGAIPAGLPSPLTLSTL